MVPECLHAANKASDLFKGPREAIKEVISATQLILIPTFMLAIMVIGDCVLSGRFPKSYLYAAFAGMGLVVIADPLVNFIFSFTAK